MKQLGLMTRWRLRPRWAGLLIMAALAVNLFACAPVNRPIGSATPVPASVRTGASKPALVTVLPGQTVYSIARANGLPLRSLIEENALKPPYLLRVGQTLRLPQVDTYIVVAGDTVSTIALRMNVDMRRLVVLNAIQPPYVIQVGQRLRLPGIRVAGAALPKASSGPIPDRSASNVSVPAIMALPLPRPAFDRPTTTIATAPVPATKSPAAVTAKAVRTSPPAAKPPANFRPPPRSKSAFLVPVNGRVIGRFGPRKGGLHNDGINIAAPIGAPIKAAENGIVAYAGAGFGGFGKLLLIKHADGWISAYGHAQKLLVARGAQVRRGQVIATVGKSGGVSRPQLHFELRRGSRALNPEKYIGS